MNLLTEHWGITGRPVKVMLRRWLIIRLRPLALMLIVHSNMLLWSSSPTPTLFDDRILVTSHSAFWLACLDLVTDPTVVATASTIAKIDLTKQVVHQINVKSWLSTVWSGSIVCFACTRIPGFGRTSTLDRMAIPSLAFRSPKFQLIGWCPLFPSVLKMVSVSSVQPANLLDIGRSIWTLKCQLIVVKESKWVSGLRSLITPLSKLTWLSPWWIHPTTNSFTSKSLVKSNLTKPVLPVVKNNILHGYLPKVHRLIILFIFPVF